jgi:hypothetical protein
LTGVPVEAVVELALPALDFPDFSNLVRIRFSYFPPTFIRLPEPFHYPRRSVAETSLEVSILGKEDMDRDRQTILMRIIMRKLNNAVCIQ